MCIAAAIVGGSAIGAIGSAVSAHSAASAQENAANQANATERAQYNQTRADLLPYQTAGQGFTNQLTARMGDLTAPFSMTQQQLEATPGYQFTKTQGLKAVDNALGARGLLNSGAVFKGAGAYATGLADQTYMDQFNIDQTQKQNIYNKLLGGAQLGENAAAQTGAYGTQTAASIGANTIGAGNAAAAADNATGAAFGSIGNAIGTGAILGKYGNQIFNPYGAGIFGGKS